MIEQYDAVLFDLDGVIYLGPKPVPGAADAVRELRARQVTIGYVTNNAARSPQAVADHLTSLEVSATSADVVTSAQAGARLLAEHLPSGAKVLIMGTDDLAHEVAHVGLVPVYDVSSAPDAVVQGFNPQLTWEQVENACEAIHQGALWVATNTDSTRPTDRGIMPGNGSMVAAVQMAVGKAPLVAGKPYRPLIEEAVHRTDATNALFVGDRLDTDIEGAQACGLDSAMVLTGAHGAADLLHAHAQARPTHLLVDLSELFVPARTVTRLDDGFECAAATVRLIDGALVVDGPTETAAQRADLLWAAAHTCWVAHDVAQVVDVTAVLEVM